MTADSDATGWASAATAARYAEFADVHRMYRRTSAELVDRLALAAQERVLDLCAGTGVTTATVLTRLGPEGSVVAVDGSASMLEVARTRIDDPRVEWVEARAENVAEAVAGQVDAAVCNSAIWQTMLRPTFESIAALLRPGAKCVCNIGRNFLIMPFTEAELTNTKPGLTQLMAAYAAIDLDYAPPAGALRGGGPALTPDSVNDALRAAGLEPEPPEVSVHEQSVDEFVDWLRIRIFTERVLPGLSYETRMSLLDRALEKFDRSSADTEMRWVIFQATKRGAV